MGPSSSATYGVNQRWPQHAPMSECNYLEPTPPVVDETFFHNFINRAKDEAETFDSMMCSFRQSAPFCHRFQFKYPLQDRVHAEVFARVLQIKAQEAHRFVPAIALSRFDSTSHLGFRRTINIVDAGPKIQEHLLVDKGSNKVIFIEETVEVESDKIFPGCFVAVNEIVEENGFWYFAGTYLYNSKPESDKIENTVKMFQATYDNMMSFIETGKVAEVYNQLSKF